MTQGDSVSRRKETRMERKNTILQTGGPAIQIKSAHQGACKSPFPKFRTTPPSSTPPPHTHTSPGTEDMKILRNVWGNCSPGNRLTKNMKFNHKIIENFFFNILLPWLSILTVDSSFGTLRSRLLWLPRDEQGQH